MRDCARPWTQRTAVWRVALQQQHSDPESIFGAAPLTLVLATAFPLRMDRFAGGLSRGMRVAAEQLEAEERWERDGLQPRDRTFYLSNREYRSDGRGVTGPGRCAFGKLQRA